MTRVVVLGGYGVFGSRAAERLARSPGLEVIVAGRSATAAKAAAEALSRNSPMPVAHAVLDATTLSAGDLERLRAGILVHTAGPYQTQDYRVARTAIRAGVHYIDLADARAFVTQIGTLDAEARAADVLVVSGASSVPALAAAVVDTLGAGLTRLDEIDCGISPGNSFDPGAATAASILGGVGKPFTILTQGRWQTAYGWQPLHRHRFREAGMRWFGACNVPDLDLFPARYASLETQRFLAGVEVKTFHAALWALSWLVRWQILRDPARFAAPVLALKRRFATVLGTDRGAMFVDIRGQAGDGAHVRRGWELCAFRGHGPYIPAAPAVILAKALAAGRLTARGAHPCVGFFTLDDFTQEVADLDIRQVRT